MFILSMHKISWNLIMSWTIYLGMRSPKHEVSISSHSWNFMYNICQKQGRIEKGEQKDSCGTFHNSTHIMNNPIWNQMSACRKNTTLVRIPQGTKRFGQFSQPCCKALTSSDTHISFYWKLSWEIGTSKLCLSLSN